MKAAVLVARLLLGLIFTVLGFNLLVPFIPAPAQIPGNAGAFMGAMASSHFVYLVGGAQLAGGLLLLTNQYVPLALVTLAAVIANILVFHLTMWPQALIPLPILVTVLWFVVAWPLRAHFAPLLARTANPR